MTQDEMRNRYQRGMEAFNAAKFDKAAKLLESIGDGKEMRSALARYYAGQARHQLGLEDLKAGRYASAADHFRRALDHNPQ